LAVREAWAKRTTSFHADAAEFEEPLNLVLAADGDDYFDFGDQLPRWLRDMCVRWRVPAPDEDSAAS
jgi:hypothetical protein